MYRGLINYQIGLALQELVATQIEERTEIICVVEVPEMRQNVLGRKSCLV